jgi:hypothetical protein
MKKRTRDRRGRYLKKGRSHKVRARKRGRRSAARSSSRKRRRNAPRASNPPAPRRRRRSHARRPHAGKIRYRTKTVRVRGRRRSNPPYTLKSVAVALLVTSAGFASAELAPVGFVKLVGKPEWNHGWAGAGLSAGSTILTALVGYGIGRLISSKRTATMIAAELAIGGSLATGVKGARLLIAMKNAPAPQPQAPMPALQAAGVSGFTPQQLAKAESARRLLGLGYLTPQEYAAAGASTFGVEKNW